MQLFGRSIDHGNPVKPMVHLLLEAIAGGQGSFNSLLSFKAESRALIIQNFHFSFALLHSF